MLGNVIGSNIFNLLAVIGVAGTIAPHEFESRVLFIDYPIMAGLTLAVIVLAYNHQTANRLGRPVGGLLFGSFIVYHSIVAWGALTA